MDCAYLIDEDMVEAVMTDVRNDVRVEHQWNKDICTACDKLRDWTESLWEYPSDYVRVYWNTHGTFSITIMVKTGWFKKEWVEVCRDSQWYKWTTPDMRENVVTQIHEVANQYKQKQLKEREEWNAKLAASTHKYEEELARKQSIALEQWS